MFICNGGHVVNELFGADAVNVVDHHSEGVGGFLIKDCVSLPRLGVVLTLLMVWSVVRVYYLVIHYGVVVGSGRRGPVFGPVGGFYWCCNRRGNVVRHS